MIQNLVVGIPALRNRRHAEHDAAFLGKLEGVRKKVADDLLEPLRIGEDIGRKFRIHFDSELQIPVFRDMAERPFDVVVQFGKAQSCDIDRDRPGLDLGKIEDIVDQAEQIIA